MCHLSNKTFGHSQCLTFVERNITIRHILHLRNKPNTGSFILLPYDMIREGGRNPEVLHFWQARYDV